MAIRTVLAFLQVNVLEMDCCLKFIFVRFGNDAVISVEEVSFPVSLEHRAKHPTLTVKIGKLGVLELLVELRGAEFLEKSRIGPQSASGGRLRIRLPGPVALFIGRVVLLLGI